MAMNTDDVNFTAAPAPLTVLAADDTPANLALIEAVLSTAGHILIVAKSGEEAVLKYQEVSPDVVLMDVMMPGIGGIEATRRIRALNPDKWVPIIFISALSHRDDMVRGLEAGGDDYLGKPIDVALLLAKINAMQRIALLKDRLSKSNAQLDAYRYNSERELDMARELMEHMIKGASTSLPDVELWLQPAANLGGDLLLTRKCGCGLEYLLLADAMGHGLSAAMPLIPLVQVFSEMTSKCKFPREILREANMQLSNLLPSGNFVAVTLISIDRSKKQIEVWNGGNPPALLTDKDGKVLRKFKSRQLSLGILRDAEFDDSMEIFHWDEECRLVLYSDGLADAANASGEEFGEEGIMSALRGGTQDGLKEAVTEHLGGLGANDDISIATATLK